MLNELARLDLPAEAGSHGSKALEQAKLVEVAREFEAMLLAQLLTAMRQSMFSDDEDNGFGSETETMFDTMHAEVARQLARTGGMGLADSLIHGMREARLKPGTTTEFPTITAEVTTTEAATDVRSARLQPGLLASPVSSPFGWRRDPLGDRPKFHAGIDFAAAYGTAVPAPAPGRVVFAGEQGSYGLTVLVEHRPGLQTRYAHLSGVDVREGDVLTAGQAVGRVGQSGRATGAHLHFEVIQNGERVDPQLLGDARLKAAFAHADFLSGGDPSARALRGVDDED